MEETGSLQRRLAGMRSEVSSDELRRQIAAARQQGAQMEAKLKGFRSGGAKPIDVRPQEMRTSARCPIAELPRPLSAASGAGGGGEAVCCNDGGLAQAEVHLPGGESAVDVICPGGPDHEGCSPIAALGHNDRGV